LSDKGKNLATRALPVAYGVDWHQMPPPGPRAWARGGGRQPADAVRFRGRTLTGDAAGRQYTESFYG